jgi:hypothetical protein
MLISMRNEVNCNIFSVLFCLFIISNSIIAQNSIFNSIPDWESNPLGQYATGLGVADINGDGWDDIVVANGNDMARQHLSVYYNNLDGTFPRSPSWNSDDVDYHGHLSVGDIDGDGDFDVAVSVFLGPARFSELGVIKVYFNEGIQLESNPSYQTADSMFTFSCALGDADGDGDLDLAVAGGQPYNIGMGPSQTNGRIYYNENGILDTLPRWQSQVSMGALDVDFADMDGNGYLDLIFACHLTPNYIFLADSIGQISLVPSWQSQDNSYYANSLSIARIDDNKYFDLVVSDNDQLGGEGKFKAYIFNDTPNGQSSPAWTSNTGGYGSAVLAEELTGDMHVDLLAGSWWGNIKLYEGTIIGFNSDPQWTSTSSSVIEAFMLKDLDQDGYYQMEDTITVTTDSLRVIYLSEMTIEKIESVFLNDQPLISGSDYCSVPQSYWISFNKSLINGDRLNINYIASNDRDLVITNWDTDVGNYIFYNQTIPVSIDKFEKNFLSEQISVFPNPFNQYCTFKVKLIKPSAVDLAIYDITGRIIKKISGGNLITEEYKYLWNGSNDSGNEVSSGMYIYVVNTSDKIYSGKVLLIK